MWSCSLLIILVIVRVALCEITGPDASTDLTSDGKPDQIFSSRNFSFIPISGGYTDLEFLRNKLDADRRKLEREMDELFSSSKEIPYIPPYTPPPPPPRRYLPIVWAIVVLKIVFIFIYICLKCSKGKHCYESAPVIVTSTTTTTANPTPYPISVQSTPGGGFQATPYPTGGGAIPMPMPQPQMMVTNPPYPTHGGAMPQPYGAVPGYPSNPPYPATDPSRMNPPSYDQVVNADPTQKQAPYNPHYMGN